MGLVFFIVFSIVAHATLGDSSCSSWDEPLPTGFFRSIESKLVGYGYAHGDPRGTPRREATVFGLDDRKLVDIEIYPYRTIGKLFHEKGACSSALISPCHIITSRHCLNKNNNKYKIQYGSNEPVHAKTVLKGQGDNFEADWAVMKLERSVGTDLGWMPIRERTPKQLEGGKCRLGGYPGDINQGRDLLVDHGATFKGDFSTWKHGDPPPGWKAYGKHMVQLKVDAYLGNSGGPVFCMDKAGVANLVAVLSFVLGNPGGNTYVDEDSDQFSGAVATSSFAKTVNQFLEEDSCPEGHASR
jgi:V8-like Glu-specific endopeptidase